jgi:hypothetical protein
MAFPRAFDVAKPSNEACKLERLNVERWNDDGLMMASYTLG